MWRDAAEPEHRATQMQARRVALGGLVEAGGDAAPVPQPVDTALHGLRSLYSVVSWRPDGRPAPRFLRFAAWSAFSGITARILRRRR